MYATNDSIDTKLWTKRAFVFFSVLFLVQLLLSVWEYKLPSTDIFLFKEAGIQFALHNEFKAADLPHFPPHEKVWFSYYPPVYPFCFGVWTKVFGLGLSQSLAYDALIRVFRSLALYFFFLLCARRLSRETSWRELILFGLLSFVTTDGDRPDDLALLFGILCFLCLYLKKPWWVAAIFLGLSGASSPAAALYFGLGQFVLEKNYKRSFLVAVFGFLLFNAITVPIQWADREAYLRFAQQLPLSVFPYMQRWRAEHRILGTYYDWRGYYWNAIDLVRPYFHLILIYFGLLFYKPFTLYENKLVKYNIFFFFFWLIVWTLQPFYLWFLVLTSLCVVLAYCRERFIYIAILIAFTPLFLKEAKNIYQAFSLPVEESKQFVLKRIEGEVPLGEKLVVTPDQYFTFRSKWELANMTYICNYLEDFRYIYVSRFQNSHRELPNYEFFCKSKANLFEPKQNLTHFETFKFLARESSYFIKGASGVLYKKKS